MKTEKLFHISTPNGEFYGKTVSAIMDILAEQNINLPHWRIWKLPKEIGDSHEFPDFELTLEVLPLMVHQNPNKGKYLRGKLK